MKIYFTIVCAYRTTDYNLKLHDHHTFYVSAKNVYHALKQSVTQICWVLKVSYLKVFACCRLTMLRYCPTIRSNTVSLPCAFFKLTDSIHGWLTMMLPIARLIAWQWLIFVSMQQKVLLLAGSPGR